MGTRGQGSVDRPAAMIVKRAVLPGRLRGNIILIVTLGQQRRFQIGNPLIEQAIIAGRPQIVAGQQGQPQQVIGKARPQAPPDRLRMPPVEHIALHELMPCMQQELPPRE